jgi:hypothetical protein
MKLIVGRHDAHAANSQFGTMPSRAAMNAHIDPDISVRSSVRHRLEDRR